MDWNQIAIGETDGEDLAFDGARERGITGDETRRRFVAEVIAAVEENRPKAPVARDERQLERCRAWPLSGETFVAQLRSIPSWEAQSRASAVRAPTLILHGESNRIIAPRASTDLAASIPGAAVTFLPHAGHLFSTDQPDAAHAAVESFLAHHAV